MARVGIITDAHANLPALRAALAALQHVGCEVIYHTGDAIGIGPYPAECLALLLSTPHLRPLMGNHDAWYAFGLPQPRPAWMSEGEAAHHQWVHAQLGAERRAEVARWPYVLQEDVEGVRLTLLHYGLDQSLADWQPVVREPTAADLDAMFAPFDADLVCYGHHHAASDLQGRARYLSPGSLGCSAVPEARFLVIECEAGEYRLRKGAVGYDDRPLFEAFEQRDVPEREFIRTVFFSR